MKNTQKNQESESLDHYRLLFIEFIENNIKENQIDEENFSSNLQELYFKNSTFPRLNHLVALKDLEVRTTIFKPLFNRHMKNKVNEEILWDQYTKLFDMILNGNEDTMKDLDLPNEW